MRFIHYALTLLFGLLGTLSALRSVERLLTGKGVMVVQVFFAMGGLLLATTFLRKARRSGGRPTTRGTN